MLGKTGVWTEYAQIKVSEAEAQSILNNVHTWSAGRCTARSVEGRKSIQVTINEESWSRNSARTKTTDMINLVRSRIS